MSLVKDLRSNFNAALKLKIHQAIIMDILKR